jgi:DNA-binding GntR family transcriptional regulator
MSLDYSDFPVPRSVAEAAWLDLREKILEGELVPGTPLLLKEQADRLGISIMPVREALKRLQQEGLVLQLPQRGATVAPISAEEMEDTYLTRIALESLAVKQASQRITEANHKHLSEILDSFVNEYARGNVRAGREYHRRFHMDLYRVANSKTLNRLIPPLLDNSERYRLLTIQTRGSLAERAAEHQRILDACMRHDGEEAARLLQEHLGRTMRLVKGVDTD